MPATTNIRSGPARVIRTVALAGGLLLFAPLARAIVVAPHHAFLDHRTRSGVIYLHNPGAEPEEVSISFVFGYPASDSAGNVSVRFIEEPAPDDPSLAGWIRAFPRRARVEPGATRAVRLLARPPAGLEDGEYWARAIVSSRPAEPPPTPAETDGVEVGLTLEVRTVIPVTYRKGSVSTGVAITGTEAAVVRDSLITRIGLRRVGNAAFLGTLHLSLTNAAGDTAISVDRQVAVYRELLRRTALSIDDIPAGPYELNVRIDTDRSDLDPELVLEAEPAETTRQVRIP